MTLPHEPGAPAPEVLADGNAPGSAPDRWWLVNSEVVCDAHRLAAEDAALRAGGFVSAPHHVQGQACARCDLGEEPQEHWTDRFGNPVCGTSFMGGTVCTLAPEHVGGCAAGCQRCGGGWYAGTCSCADEP